MVYDVFSVGNPVRARELFGCGFPLGEIECVLLGYVLSAWQKYLRYVTRQVVCSLIKLVLVPFNILQAL